VRDADSTVSKRDTRPTPRACVKAIDMRFRLGPGAQASNLGRRPVGPDLSCFAGAAGKAVHSGDG